MDDFKTKREFSNISIWFMQVLSDNFANTGLVFIIFPLTDISSFNRNYLIS